MNRPLAPISIMLAVMLLVVNFPALAVDRTFQIEVENSLRGTVPSNWWVHASWRAPSYSSRISRNSSTRSNGFSCPLLA
jgi:hypothetical protein